MRKILVVLIVFAVAAMGAVTTHTLTRKGIGSDQWTASIHTADANTTEIVKAKPGAGLILKVTKLIVGCDANITVTLGADEDANAVETIYMTLPFNVSSGPYVFDFGDNPMVIGDANSSFCVCGSGAGDVFVYAEGYTDSGS